MRLYCNGIVHLMELNIQRNSPLETLIIIFICNYISKDETLAFNNLSGIIVSAALQCMKLFLARFLNYHLKQFE